MNIEVNDSINQETPETNMKLLNVLCNNLIKNYLVR